jgi:hypothetical protein
MPENGVDLGRLARGRQLGLPAVGEAVLQFGENGLVRLAPFIEIAAQVGRAGQFRKVPSAAVTTPVVSPSLSVLR